MAKAFKKYVKMKEGELPSQETLRYDERIFFTSSKEEERFNNMDPNIKKTVLGILQRILDESKQNIIRNQQTENLSNREKVEKNIENAKTLLEILFLDNHHIEPCEFEAAMFQCLLDPYLNSGMTFEEFQEDMQLMIRGKRHSFDKSLKE